MQGILFSGSDEITPKDVGIGGNRHRGRSRKSRHYSICPTRRPKRTISVPSMPHTSGNVLTLSKGNVTQAARSCGLERQALQQIMRRYGITAEPYRQ